MLALLSGGSSMTEDAREAGGPPPRGGRSRAFILAAVALAAAIVGGIAGGLIVRATWGSGNGSSTTARGSAGTGAACPAASVANRALPSVVTVRAGNGRQSGSGSGVAIRSGGYILTNNHVISVAANG